MYNNICTTFYTILKKILTKPQMSTMCSIYNKWYSLTM